MNWLMFIGQIFFLFILRQLSLPLIQGLADIIVIAITGYLWLWRGLGMAKWSLLFISLFIDILVARGLPFYTLASFISLIIGHFLLLPYLSRVTALSRLVTFAVWLGIWRVSYFIVLALGWMVGEVAFEVDKLWVGLSWWLVAAVGIVVVTLLLSRRLLRRGN